MSNLLQVDGGGRCLRCVPFNDLLVAKAATHESPDVTPLAPKPVSIRTASVIATFLSQKRRESMSKLPR